MPKYKNTIKLLALTALATTVSGHANASGTTKSVPSKIQTKKASSFPASVHNPIPGEIIVKCAGIAKKGKNHCGANGHACGGKALKDFDKNEWVYVRKEVCDVTPGRIVGKKKVIKG